MPLDITLFDKCNVACSENYDHYQKSIEVIHYQMFWNTFWINHKQVLRSISANQKAWLGSLRDIDIGSFRAIILNL